MVLAKLGLKSEAVRPHRLWTVLAGLRLKVGHGLELKTSDVSAYKM